MHVMTCIIADIMIVHAIISPCTYHAARDTQSADDETAKQLFQTCTSSK